jgi:hypothetical protein
MMRAK